MSQNLDAKTEELIALGVAYALSCQKCMKVHKKAARDAGVTAEEMRQSLSVAESVMNGAREVNRELAETIFGGSIKDVRCCPEGSECCP